MEEIKIYDDVITGPSEWIEVIVQFFDNSPAWEYNAEENRWQFATDEEDANE